MASATTAAGSSPASARSRDQAHGALVGDDEAVDAQAVAQDADAGVGERGGGFHDGEVARYPGVLTDPCKDGLAGWTTSPRQSSRPGGVHAGQEHGARLGRLLEEELRRGAASSRCPARATAPRHGRVRRRPRGAGCAPRSPSSPRCAWTPTRPASAPGCSRPRRSARWSWRRRGHRGHRRRARGAPCCSRSPATAADAELAAMAFEEHVQGIDRLRARAVAVPAHVLAGGDLREPIGATHPLVVAARVAALGGRPADEALAGRARGRGPRPARGRRRRRAPVARPHDDPDPARRRGRRILQRLHGMGKWGGYHTDFAHLSRGFAGNDRALAERVGEALLAAGLLAEKPSVGQRHVFLNPAQGGHPRAHRARRGARRPPPPCEVPDLALMDLATRAHTARTLLKAGFVRPSRPHGGPLGPGAPPLGPDAGGRRHPSAIRQPDRPAIVDELGTLTWREVHERTNAIAHGPRRRGRRRGRRAWRSSAATTAASSRRRWPA